MPAILTGVLNNILIPDICTIVLDYISTIELLELGFKRKITVSADDALSYRIYTTGKCPSFPNAYIQNSPDYLRYAILLQAKYLTKRRFNIIDIPTDSLIPIIVRSPKLSCENDSLGLYLFQYAIINHDADLLRKLIKNQAFYTKMDTDIKNIANTVLMIKRSAEPSMAWVFHQPCIPVTWLRHFLDKALRRQLDITVNAILERLRSCQDMPSMDVLTTAMVYNHKFIIPCIDHNLFIPHHLKYVDMCLNNDYTHEQIVKILTAVGTEYVVIEPVSWWWCDDVKYCRHQQLEKAFNMLPESNLTTQPEVNPGVSSCCIY